MQTAKAEPLLFQAGGCNTCIRIDKTENLIFGKKLDQRILWQAYNQLHNVHKADYSHLLI
jgi:hypothetical protein